MLLKEGELIIERLKPEFQPLLKLFECRHDDENKFLREDALPQQEGRFNTTYLLFENAERKKVISYITLAVGSFILSPDKEILGIKIRDKPYELPTKVPCILIGHLATDKTEESRGGGSHLLQFAIKYAVQRSPEYPAPFLALHAYPDKVNWYGKRGFEVAFTPKDSSETTPMFMHLQSISPEIEAKIKRTDKK